MRESSRIRWQSLRGSLHWIVLSGCVFVVLAIGPFLPERLIGGVLPGALIAFVGIGLLAVAAAVGISGMLWPPFRDRRMRRVSSDLGMTYLSRFRFPPGSHKLPGLGSMGDADLNAGHRISRSEGWAGVVVFDLMIVGTTGYERPDRSTCAMGPIAANCLPTLIEPRRHDAQRVFDGLDEELFESEEFDRRYRVVTMDTQFANAFVDSRMIDWLLGLKEPTKLQVGSTWLMVQTPLLDPSRIPWLMERYSDFAAKVPRVIMSLYPPTIEDDDQSDGDPPVSDAASP